MVVPYGPSLMLSGQPVTVPCRRRTWFTVPVMKMAGAAKMTKHDIAASIAVDTARRPLVSRSAAADRAGRTIAGLTKGQVLPDSSPVPHARWPASSALIDAEPVVYAVEAQKEKATSIPARPSQSETPDGLVSPFLGPAAVSGSLTSPGATRESRRIIRYTPPARQGPNRAESPAGWP